MKLIIQRVHYKTQVVWIPRSCFLSPPSKTHFNPFDVGPVDQYWGMCAMNDILHACRPSLPFVRGCCCCCCSATTIAAAAALSLTTGFSLLFPPFLHWCLHKLSSHWPEITTNGGRGSGSGSSWRRRMCFTAAFSPHPSPTPQATGGEAVCFLRLGREEEPHHRRQPPSREGILCLSIFAVHALPIP